MNSFARLLHRPPMMVKLIAVTLAAALLQSTGTLTVLAEDDEHDLSRALQWAGNASDQGASFEAPAGDGSGAFSTSPLLVIRDTGINPYHIDFRASSGAQLPPGLPPVEEVQISLDAPDLETALLNDKASWQGLDPETLYHFAGTRVLAIYFEPRGECSEPCFPIFDYGGHGTGVASAGVGIRSSLVPEGWVLLIQNSPTWRTYDWLLGLDAADVFSLSYGSLAGIELTAGAAQTSYDWHESGGVWFNGAGNEIYMAIYGVHTIADGTSGAPWVTAVGRADQHGPSHYDRRGADILGRDRLPVASHESLDGYRDGSGTSYSSPRVAAAAAHLVLVARESLGDIEGRRDGLLSRAPPGHPLPSQGPLADGNLTNDELVLVLKRTAVPLPFDSGLMLPGTGPETSYFYEGYGLVDVESIRHAEKVLRGEAPLPEREWAEKWEKEHDQVAQEYWDHRLCINHFEDWTLPSIYEVYYCHRRHSGLFD